MSQAGPTQDVRFSLREMFIAMTVLAALLALFRLAGIWGAVLAWIAAVAFSLWIYPAIASRDVPRQRLMFDFVWGVCLPLVCLVFDGFVFKQDSALFGDPLDFDQSGPARRQFYDLAFFAYPFFALQMLCFSGSLVAQRHLSCFAPLLAGLLSVGFCVAGVVGIMLFPMAFAGTFVGIGVLGFTPLITAIAYYRRTSAVLFSQPGRELQPWGTFQIVAGLVLAIVAPLAAGTVSLGMVHGWDRVGQFVMQ